MLYIQLLVKSMSKDLWQIHCLFYHHILSNVYKYVFLFLRDESPMKANFLQNMVEDRTESALSYYEFLLHIQQQVNKWTNEDIWLGYF